MKKVKFEGCATRSEMSERFDLISPAALEALARRAGLGAVRHGERNWESGGEKFRQATINHLFKHLKDYMANGNANDENTDAIIWNAMALCHLEAKAPFKKGKSS